MGLQNAVTITVFTLLISEVQHTNLREEVASLKQDNGLSTCPLFISRMSARQVLSVHVRQYAHPEAGQLETI